MIDFASIKERHSLESVLERRYNVELKRSSGGFTCCCPVHGEKTPSCHVNTAKQLWHCFGCDAGGSVLDLVMQMEGAANAKAAAELLEGRTFDRENAPAPKPRPSPLVVERELPSLPKCYPGEKRHHEKLAALRKLDAFAIRLAAEFGCLRYCLAYDQPAYAVLDAGNPCNVQVRRLDGQLWFDRAKVMGLKGNWAAWPVGLQHAVHKWPKAPIALVEGTGDFLAAWTLPANLHREIAPVAMFGAGQSIHEGALPMFEGRDITIIQQHDPAGLRAATRWAEQLREARAANVRVWTVPTEGADLNDYISAGGDITQI